MKFKYCVLLCTLIPYMGISQEKPLVEQDSAQKVTQLSEVILFGDHLTDPVSSVENQDYLRKVVQPRNVADLFSDFNGFSLIKRGNYAIDPSFRATQYEQLNVQFDGGTKVMHACPNRMDPITTHIIPEEIEKIEVIKGPYTVRYGATFGGVVNLVTRKFSEKEKGLHGYLSSGYESNGDSKVSLFQLEQVSEKWDLSGNVGHREFGNYEDGSGNEIPSAFRSLDYGVKAGIALEKQQFQLQWRQSFGRDVLHAGLPMDTEEDNSSVITFDHKLQFRSSTSSALNSKLYYAQVDHIMSNIWRPTFNAVEAVSNVNSTTIGGKLEFEWKPTDKLTNYSGIDAVLIGRDGGRTRWVKINPMGVQLAQPMEFYDKVWQDAILNDVGIFTEFSLRSSDRTLLRSGIRLDHVSSDIRDPEVDFAATYPGLGSRNEVNFSGNLSVKHQLTEAVFAEAAFGRGVRSANMIERFINHFTVGQDPYEYVGNPDLKAEVNNQLEVGLKYNERFNSGFIEGLRLSGSVYYSNYENYIVPVVDPTLTRKYMPNAEPQEVKRFVNLDKAYKNGFELAFEMDLPFGFDLKSEFSYVYTKNKDLGEALPLTPPLTSRVIAGWEHDKVWTRITFSAIAEQDKLAPSFGEVTTPGYSLLDFRAGLEVLKGMDLGLACLNVFDETYTNHLNFSFVNQADFGRVPVNDPGRNISVFVQYSF